MGQLGGRRPQLNRLRAAIAVVLALVALGVVVSVILVSCGGSQGITTVTTAP